MQSPDIYDICFIFYFAGTDLDRFDTLSHSGDMYVHGQPLDHEPSMGQVPVIPGMQGGPPPPNDHGAWVPPGFSSLPPPPHQGHPLSFMHGRRSPNNVPLSSVPPHPGMPTDNGVPGSGMPQGPNGPPQVHPMGLMGTGHGESDSPYRDYPPASTHSHVEVY